MKKLILSGCLIINQKGELLLLYKDKHKHYETPGGKVELSECKDPRNPTLEELAKTVEREAYEELGNDIQLEPLVYFGKVDFTIPDGRKATAHKFITTIKSGEPRINEPDAFSKLDYLPIDRLEAYPISPDLKLIASKIKEGIKKK